MAKKKQTPKTNAIRMVESEGLSYQMYEYDAPDGFLDGVSVAKTLGQNPRQVFKTLVAIGSSKEYYVCVIPVEKELDLKKAAKHFGEKKMEMILARNITQVTGYIKGGCSPVGMKKLYQTAIDISAEAFDDIIVSGGKVGLQMELPLEGLVKITKAHLVDLVVETK